MIHPRYHEAFCTLTQDELQCCLVGLRTERPRKTPEISDGEEFLGHCIAEHISQAEVVMALAHQPTVAAVTATERPHHEADRPPHCHRGREGAPGSNPRAIAAPVSAREATTDMR
jgi:LDH2 family malate/lactate/ureidoglycolate dehydrogenase